MKNGKGWWYNRPLAFHCQRGEVLCLKTLGSSKVRYSSEQVIIVKPQRKSMAEMAGENILKEC